MKFFILKAGPGVFFHPIYLYFKLYQCHFHWVLEKDENHGGKYFFIVLHILDLPNLRTRSTSRPAASRAAATRRLEDAEDVLQYAMIGVREDEWLDLAAAETTPEDNG